MNINSAERETIGLCIVTEAIGNIVNHELLDFRDIEDRPEEAITLFPTSIHQQLFLIRLVDFAKEKCDVGLTGVNGSCIEVLISACKTQSFEVQGNIGLMRDAIERLKGWLHAPATLKLWLPSIDVEVSLNVSRLQLLYISGNQAKHNVSRLTGLSRNIQKMLETHGHSVLLEQVPLILEDFKAHLDDNFFVYYGTWIAELLNDVRWGIQQYLLPTYQASFKRTQQINELKFRYEYPTSIKEAIPKSWFCRLMNHVRSGPCVKKFRAVECMRNEGLKLSVKH